AEDGIRDRNVTGVQTCALPISGDHGDAGHTGHPPLGDGHIGGPALLAADDRGDGRIVEAVDDVEIGLARHQIGAADPVGFELLDDEMAGGKRRGSVHTPCLPFFCLMWSPSSSSNRGRSYDRATTESVRSAA